MDIKEDTLDRAHEQFSRFAGAWARWLIVRTAATQIGNDSILD
jgi:hypothetical protein